MTDNFARTHARTDNPETSHEAARSVSGKAKIQCMEIRAVLQQHGPLTAEGISERCSLKLHQVGKRMSDLGRAGWAERTGEKQRLSSGCKGAVWVAI